MSKVLEDAAARAGLSLEQAAALLRELRPFTHGMASAGDVAIPPFAWSPEHETMLRDSFPGWEGLTRGEFNGTRAAVIWRSVCDYLIADDDGYYEWESKLWEHPKELVAE